MPDLLVNKYCAKVIKMLQLSEHFAVLHHSVTFTPLQENCYNTGEGKENLDVTAFETQFVNEDVVWSDLVVTCWNTPVTFYVLSIFLFPEEGHLLLKILRYDWNDRNITFDLKAVHMNRSKKFHP